MTSGSEPRSQPDPQSDLQSDRGALPVALTMGEPAGIGAEIAAMAWLKRGPATPAFFLVGDPTLLRSAADALGTAVPAREIGAPAEAAEIFASALPVLPVPLAAPVTPGSPAAENAPAVVAAIERAVRLALEGRASAVVTNPVQKKTLRDGGFAFPGHTEYLGALCGDVTPVMMLAVPALRVVPATIHLPLRDVFEALTSELIVEIGRITAAALARDFGIARPRIAVSGLNPHAGEGGMLGDEERTVIEPALEALRADGIAVSGPHSADTMFHPAARETYDAALSMYHDQALIPLKTLDFEHGVNVTLGLPIVRTSPDHGTALDRAGRGTASPASLIAALCMAAEIAGHRARADAAAGV